MNGPYALGSPRQSGGTIYYVNGCTLGREVKWTLVSGPGSITRITKYPNAHGVAAAYYSAGAGTSGQTPVIKAEQPSDSGIYHLLNPSFEIAGATAYDAAHWTFAYGNNGASLWTGSGFVERPASDRGRQTSLGYGQWDIACNTLTANNYLWTFVSTKAGNGCPGQTLQWWAGSGGINGFTACWAQITSDLVTWDDISTLTIPYGLTGYWTMGFGTLGNPRLQVFITSTVNTNHGAWAPAYNSTTDRYANVDIYHQHNQLVTGSIVIDTSAITGNKYLVIRVVGAANSASPEWLYIDNIVAA